MSEVTKEQLEKAEELLNLVDEGSAEKPIETGDIQKAHDYDSKEDMEKAISKMKEDYDNMHKAYKDKYGEEMDDKGLDQGSPAPITSQGKVDSGGLPNAHSSEGGEIDKNPLTNKAEEEGDIRKGEESKELKSARELVEKQDAIYKVEDDRKGINKSEMSDILKSIMDGLSSELKESINKKFTALGTLYVNNRDEQADQANEQVVIKKSIEELTTTVENLARMPAGERKAQITTTQYVDKFQKANPDGKVYRLGNPVSKEQLVNVLYDLSNIEKGENIDEGFEKAMLEVESASTITDTSTLKRLEKDHQIVVTN